jgi:malonyl-CoA/methylmalonyl-CoA synthetase
MTLTNLFDLSLRGRRDTPALEFAGRTYTFGDIEERSNRMAQYLLSRGLNTGDRLCVQLPNCAGMIDLYLACVKLGVIFVPINVLYKDREIAHILNDAEPALFLQETPDASTFPSGRPSVTLDGDTPAGIIYTSGTTGA